MGQSLNGGHMKPEINIFLKKTKGPSEYDSVEFGPDHLQQLRVEEVLTQAEGAPVASAHAAQPGVAEETHGKQTNTFSSRQWEKHGHRRSNAPPKSQLI